MSCRRCNSQGNGPAAGEPPRRPAATAADRAGARAAGCQWRFRSRTRRQRLYRRAGLHGAAHRSTPVPVPTLTVWGLRGLTALDPNLLATERDGEAGAVGGRARGGRATGAGGRRRPQPGRRRRCGFPRWRSPYRPPCGGPARRASSRASSTSCSTTSIPTRATSRRARRRRTGPGATAPPGWD